MAAESDQKQTIEAIVRNINGSTVSEWLEGVVAARKILSVERNPPIEAIMESGVVPKIVEFLDRKDETTLVFESAWALTNIASGNSENVKFLISHGALDKLIDLLDSASPEVVEQASWGIGNIAGDSVEMRNEVLRTGALPKLCQLVGAENAPKISLMRNVTWTLSNLCRGKPAPEFEHVEPAIPILAKLLRCPDEEVLTDATWALSYISDDNSIQNKVIAQLIRADVHRTVIPLLAHRNPNIKTPALRFCGNMVTGDDQTTEAMLAGGLLDYLLPLLSSPKKGIRKEACWCVSNITAGSPAQIQRVIAAGIMPALVTLAKTGESDVAKEAVWAIANATNGSDKHLFKELLGADVLGALSCGLMHQADAKIILVALEGIENLLRMGKADNEEVNIVADKCEEIGLLEQIETLQNHNNEEVYEKSVNILKSFFDAEEDDTAPVPATSNISFDQ